MPLDLTSALISTAIALIAGALLAFLATARIRRLWPFELLLWCLALSPWIVLAALRWPAALGAAAVFGAAPLIAIFGVERANATRQHCNAARSLGASEWR